MALPRQIARAVFLGLAALALASLVIALVAVFGAFSVSPTLLVIALVVLMIVVVAEVLLLIVQRPKTSG